MKASYLSLTIIAAAASALAFFSCTTQSNKDLAVKYDSTNLKPCLYLLPADSACNMIRYGRELIAHTAKYLGPHGSVAQLTNGMNCENCHLDAGRRDWGNNYFGVAPNYPKFRPRSGTIENVTKRVSDCFERSLNGHAPDSSGREMKAIIAYIQWLGHRMPKGQKPEGSGIRTLPFMDRAADPKKGQSVYAAACASCHGDYGQGKLHTDGIEYEYPPLWGPHSYNAGAGLYSLSRFAGYVYDNMPFGTATHNSPQLTEEQAWDVAAFVNSQQRPVHDISKDWPDISKKPLDYPFGPYADNFNALQHKFGPYKAIEAARKTEAGK